MVRRWLEVDKVTTKNECNAILQYFIRLFGETINLSLSIDTLLLVKELRLCCLLFAKSEFCFVVMHDDRAHSLFFIPSA